MEYDNLLIMPANGRRDLIRRLKVNAKRLVRLGVGSAEVYRKDAKQDECPTEVHEVCEPT